MITIVAALAEAFAAFCIWLTVRIVNRQERWAKWTLVGLGVTVAACLLGGVLRRFTIRASNSPTLSAMMDALYWPLIEQRE